MPEEWWKEEDPTKSRDPWERLTGEFRPEWERFAAYRPLGALGPAMTNAELQAQRSAERAAWMETPFLWGGKDWITPSEVTEQPFTLEEFRDLRQQFGSKLAGAGPLTRQRYETQAEWMFPGIPSAEFGRTPARRIASPIPPFMSKIYNIGPDESLTSLAQRARGGVKDWMAGGPDAPRILSPRDWENLLPTEREGLIGFLEYIGIPMDDYIEMMRRQQEAMTQAFGIPTKFKAARQR